MAEVRQAPQVVPDPSMENVAAGQFWHAVSTLSLKNWFFPQHSAMDWFKGQRRVLLAAQTVPNVVQDTHDDCPPAPAYVPAVHVWQARDELLPCMAENVPTGQPLHVICPTPVEYCPASQTGHAVMPAPPPKLPAGQAEQTDAAEGEK